MKPSIFSPHEGHEVPKNQCESLLLLHHSNSCLLCHSFCLCLSFFGSLFLRERQPVEGGQRFGLAEKLIKVHKHWCLWNHSSLRISHRSEHKHKCQSKDRSNCYDTSHMRSVHLVLKLSILFHYPLQIVCMRPPDTSLIGDGSCDPY